MASKKKSYMAKKNEGNNLFFLILHNILTDKSDELYREHLDNPTFDDVYSFVGIEKALSKCYDINIIASLSECQTEYSRISNTRHHYWYLMKKLSKTFNSIDWKLND